MQARPPRGRHEQHRQLGQAVVEFAVILPLLLLFMGVILDGARLYRAWVDLEGATNQAAQYIANSGGTTDPSSAFYSPASAPTSAANANNAAAVSILNSEVGQTFTAAASVGSCSSPTVTTQMQYFTGAYGGSTAHPAGQATVTACMPFRTLFPYPFFTMNGDWILSSQKQFTTLVAR